MSIVERSGAVLVAAATVVGICLPSTAGTTKDHSPNVSLVASPKTGPGGDIAFWRDLAVLAHGQEDDHPANDGFVLLDISNPRAPRKIGRFVCPGAFDVSIWRELVFVSVNATYDGPSCAASPVAPVAADAFAGIRVVSIDDPRHPRQVAAVRTGFDDASGLKGSHTHTLLPDPTHRDRSGNPAPRLLVYSSAGGGDTRTGEDVVEVPLRDPSSAHVVARIDTSPAPSCHDISFFAPKRIAAASCFAAGTQLWDVSDPLTPERLATIHNPEISNHHGAAFSNDGRTLVVADESLAAIASGTCRGGSDSAAGALWFYDVRDPRVPVLEGHFQLPRTAPGICTAHQFNVVPLESGKDVLVAGWYLGGTTVVDFTDPSDPREIGYFQPAPDDTARRSNPWASYWYNGFVYSNQLDAPTLGLGTDRGLDVLKVRHPYLRNALPMRSFNFGTQLCTFGRGGRACARGSGSTRSAGRPSDPGALELRVGVGREPPRGEGPSNRRDPWVRRDR